VYVELINSEKKSVLRQKIKVENSMAQGDIYLPSILPSGKYYLIAYTHWMLNYPREQIPVIPITLVNPFRSIPENSGDSARVEMEFFSESDRVLLDQEITFVYRIRSAANPREFRILDLSGSTLKTIQCNGQRIDRFEWIPKKAGLYQVVLTQDNDEITYHELEIHASKTHISVVKDGDQLRITPYYNGKATLQIGEMIHQVPTGSEFSIPEKELEQGVQKIRLISENQVLAQRSVLVFPGYQGIVAKIQKQEAHERDPMSLTLSSPEGAATVSIRVQQKAPYPDQGSIVDDLYFKPQGIVIDDPSEYFSRNVQWEELDNHMIIQQSSFYTSAPDSLVFTPEMRGMIIKGRIEEKESGNPVPEQVIHLSILKDPPVIFTSESDRTGDFNFTLTDLEGELDGYYSSPGNIDIRFSSAYLGNYGFLPETRWSFPLEWKNWMEQRSIQVQLENAYFEFKKDSLIPDESLPTLYGRPDESYLQIVYCKWDHNAGLSTLISYRHTQHIFCDHIL
jgi:hypothetical protein